MERFVLWVDDDFTLLDGAAQRLRENGIKVVIEPSIDEAERIVRERKEQIRGIILDLMMDPGVLLREAKHDSGFLTGFRFADYLWQSGHLTDLRVFFFTNKDAVGTKYSPQGMLQHDTESPEIRIEKKNRFKAIKFVTLVQERFPE